MEEEVKKEKKKKKKMERKKEETCDAAWRMSEKDGVQVGRRQNGKNGGKGEEERGGRGAATIGGGTRVYKSRGYF